MGQRTAAAHGRRRRRALLHQVDAHRGDQPRPGHHVLPDRARSSPGRPSIGAWLAYGLGSENQRPAGLRRPASRRGPATRPTSRSTTGSGAAASCRRSTRASSSARRATRCCSCPTRDGVDAATPAADARRPGRAEPAQARATSATRRSPRGSPSTSWPSACRRRVPELTDLSKRAGVTSSSSTAPTRASPARSPPTACSPAGWPSAASASSSSSTAAGTSTSTCPSRSPASAATPTRPRAALITDLKQRGLLDDTLVVWGGEFGRTVYCQGTLTADDYGRDHHPRCFTIWLAGGGIKPGITYGETDDFSYNIVRDPVHVHDLNATILHCLGIDHKLTYKFQGRDFRLTDVHGEVVKGVLA